MFICLYLLEEVEDEVSGLVMLERQNQRRGPFHRRQLHVNPCTSVSGSGFMIGLYQTIFCASSRPGFGPSL